MFTDKTVRDLLESFAAPTPTPAGGSASALASAVGAALLVMAASLPRTRSGSEEDRRQLTAAALALTAMQYQLANAIDRDAEAYRQVVSQRDAGLERALKGAVDVPLQIMRLSSQALKQAAVVAGACVRTVESDVCVAVLLLQAGLKGAQSSAEANLRRLEDRRYLEAVRSEIDRLAVEADLAADEAGDALSG